MAYPGLPPVASAPQSSPPPVPFDMSGFDAGIAELQGMLVDLDGDGVPDAEQGRAPQGGMDVQALGQEAKDRIQRGEPRDQVIQDLFLRVTRQRRDTGQQVAQAPAETMSDAGGVPDEYTPLPGTTLDNNPESFGYDVAPLPTGQDARNRLLQGPMPRQEQARPVAPEEEIPANTVQTNPDGSVRRFPSGGPIPDFSDGGPYGTFGRRGFSDGARELIKEEAPGLIAAAMGPIGRGVATAARSAPALTTMALSALGATAGADEAGQGSAAPLQNLTEQLSTLERRRDEAAAEMTRQKAFNRQGQRPKYDDAKSQYDALTAEIAGVRAMISDSQNAAAEERRMASPEYQLEMQQKASDLARQEKEREAATPFRERYPEVAGNLPAIGLGLAAGLPFAIGAKEAAGTFTRGSFPSRVNAAVKNADEAIATNAPNQALNRMELDRLIKAEPSTGNRLLQGAAAAGAGGALAAEANLFPDQYDAFNLPEGEDRDAAWARMTDPMEYLKRGAIGAITGLSGYEASRLIPRREAMIPEATARRDFIAREERNASKASRQSPAPESAPALPPPAAAAPEAGNRLLPGAPAPQVTPRSSSARSKTKGTMDANGHYHDAQGRYATPPKSMRRKAAPASSANETPVAASPDLGGAFERHRSLIESGNVDGAIDSIARQTGAAPDDVRRQLMRWLE